MGAEPPKFCLSNLLKTAATKIPPDSAPITDEIDATEHQPPMKRRRALMVTIDVPDAPQVVSSP